MASELCKPCADRGRETPADRTVAGTPMCRWCFAGADHPGETDINGKRVHFKNAPAEGEEIMGLRRGANGETREKVRELRDAQMNAREIAEKLGIGRNTVDYHLARLGGKTPAQDGLERGRPRADGKTAAIAKLREQGLSRTQIQKELGLSRHSLQHHLTKLQGKTTHPERQLNKNDGRRVAANLCLSEDAINAILLALSIEQKAALLEGLGDL